MMELTREAQVSAVEKVKPLLRGTFHTFGFVAALFGFAELSIAPVEGWRYVAGLMFAGSLTLMLGLSALYHRPNWSHAARNRLRMADHVGIFFLIAGTYTPIRRAPGTGESRCDSCQRVCLAQGDWPWSIPSPGGRVRAGRWLCPG